MKLKRVTPEQVMELGPCPDPYNLEYVRELFGELKTVNALNVAKSDIPVEDKMWLMLQIIPQKALDKFYEACKEKDASTFASARDSGYTYAFAFAFARVYASTYAFAQTFASAYVRIWKWMLKTLVEIIE